MRKASNSHNSKTKTLTVKYSNCNYGKMQPWSGARGLIVNLLTESLLSVTSGWIPGSASICASSVVPRSLFLCEVRRHSLLPERESYSSSNTCTVFTGDWKWFFTLPCRTITSPDGTWFSWAGGYLSFRYLVSVFFSSSSLLSSSPAFYSFLTPVGFGSFPGSIWSRGEQRQEFTFLQCGPKEKKSSFPSLSLSTALVLCSNTDKSNNLCPCK